MVEVAIFQDQRKTIAILLSLRVLSIMILDMRRNCIILTTTSKVKANSTLEHVRPRWQDKVVLKHFEKI